MYICTYIDSANFVDTIYVSAYIPKTSDLPREMFIMVSSIILQGAVYIE